MSWVAVGVAAVGAVGSIVASNKTSDAAKNAANTQANAANQANALQKQIYDQNTANMQPWLKGGTAALNQEQSLLGLNGEAPDYSSFFNSPDYKFAYDQGLANLDKSAAARGNLYSGGYGKDLVDYNQGMATQQYNSYYNKLNNLSQQGQTGAAALAGVGENYANQSGQNLTNAGTATASGQLAAGQAQAGLYNNLGSIAGNFYQQYQNQPYNVQTTNPAIQVNPGTYQYQSAPDINTEMQPIQGVY